MVSSAHLKYKKKMTIKLNYVRKGQNMEIRINTYLAFINSAFQKKQKVSAAIL